MCAFPAGVFGREAFMGAVIALAIGLLASCGGAGGDAGASADAAAPVALKAVGAAAPTALLAGPVTVANTTLDGNQSALAAGALADGGYAVLWQSDSEPGSGGVMRLLMRRFDASGTAAGPQVLVAFDEAAHPHVGMGILPDGSVIVAYAVHQQSGTTSTDFTQRDSLFAQRFGPDGAAVGSPTEVSFHVYPGFANPGFTTYLTASVLAWDDGSFLIGWSERNVSTRADQGRIVFMAQRYDAEGAAVGSARTIGSNALGFGVMSVKFTALDDGGYLTAQTSVDSGVPTVRFVPFDSAERTTPIPASGSLPQGPTLLPLALEGYLMLSSDPFARILDNAGAVLAQPSVQAGSAYALADGGFAMVGLEPAAAGQPDLRVQRYDALGNAIGDPTSAGPAGLPPPLGASLPDTALALVWSRATAQSGMDVYTQLLSEPDLSRRQQVRACHEAATSLHGKQHRQFMQTCLKNRERQ
jgi:hypothetical protein